MAGMWIFSALVGVPRRFGAWWSVIAVAGAGPRRAFTLAYVCEGCLPGRELALQNVSTFAGAAERL